MAAKTTNRYTVVRVNIATGQAEKYKGYATEKGATNYAAKMNREKDGHDYLDMPTVAANTIVERANAGELVYSVTNGEFEDAPITVVDIPGNLVMMMKDLRMHVAAAWQKICTNKYGVASVIAALAA